MRFARRLSLQYRIAAGVVFGLVALFSLFGFLAVRTIDQSKDVALEERLALAQTTGHAVDGLIRHATAQLEAAATLWALDPDDPEEQQIGMVYYVLGTFATITRLDADGRVLWSVPAGSQPPAWLPSIVLLLPQLGNQAPTQTVQLTSADLEHPPVAIVIHPISGAALGPGYVVADVRLSYRDIELVPLEKGDKPGEVETELVDAQGNIILHPAGPYTMTEHADILAPLVARREPGTRIHDPPQGKKHVVAYYPLESVGGGVVVEQTADKALAVPNSMRRTMLYFGFGSLLVASVAAWLHARSVVGPIRELTSASSRIAGGALDIPIVSRRDDEVGELASSFESMRVKLKAHLDERQRWGEELERRVRERTREVNLLLGKVISAQEEERKRVARELHDETAQALATLLVGIQTADEALPPSAAEAKAALNRLKPQATRTLEEIRRMILDLRPSALDDLGWAAAIRWYAENSLEPRGVAVAFRVSGEEKRLSGPLETALFRMAQEAVNNVARHAEAGNARLHLRFARRRVVIDVEDDGKGFDVQEVAASTDETRGLGLLGLKERAALFSGSVTIESQPGRGTRIHIEVPVGDGEDTRTAGR